MPELVLATLNARYWHSSFGLRYLHANLAELQERAVIREFVINDQLNDILEKILSEDPRIVGFGVYIWNIEQTTQLVQNLKQVRPEITVVIGGPEVSYELEGQPIVSVADYVITGEADIAFRDLCRDLLSGRRPLEKVNAGGIPTLDQVEMPYDFYTAEDLQHRILYVEASRGCPFQCEFCLSSLDIPVRQFDVDSFLAAMQNLFDRGARHFKFVDRTFNLNIRVGVAILQFFLERYEPGLFLHFEMIPDRLPSQLKELIAQFPNGALQFEIGIQTFNEQVEQNISRRQNHEKLIENFRFLREQTGVHIHADLIVGLPGESLESFAAGFDKLVELDPQEIQVGILKRLKGTPIIRHDDEWEMVYSTAAPYEILSNKLLSFADLQRLRRFARFWDLVANSGNFLASRDLLWKNGHSPFARFLQFSDWLYEQEARTHAISLQKLFERLFEFLTSVLGQDASEVATTLWLDYTRHGREDRPHFLRPFPLPNPRQLHKKKEEALPSRQARHVEG